MIWQGNNPAHIEQAAQRLADGALLAFPTETVYGLGADAGQDAAVAALYAAKGRPSTHPLIVHIASPEDTAHFTAWLPDFAQALMSAHWPGPLTLILPRRQNVAHLCAAGQNNIGLRCPNHPTAQALLHSAKRMGVLGVAGPSANRFGRVSPTRAEHVTAEFGTTIDVLDGGSCRVGIESSIVDCTRDRPVLLRPGMLDIDLLSQSTVTPVLNPLAARQTLAQPEPRASGSLSTHYAPTARLRLLDPEAMDQRSQSLSPVQLAALAVWSPHRPHFRPGHWRIMPSDAVSCAHQLFETLHDFERHAVQEIWVCPPPPGVSWDGVRDRLTRASH